MTEQPPAALLASEAFVLVVEPQQPPAVVVASGNQGPAGPPGVTEEDAVYAKRVDMVGDSLIYRGEAVVGTLAVQPLWRIRRITFIGDDVSEEWAGGSAAFDKAWSDRAALGYS